MVDLEAAAQMAMALPEVTEGVRHGNRTWTVGREGVRVGAAVQQGGPQALRRRDAAGRTDPRGVGRRPRSRRKRCSPANPKAFFTIPHFDGYAAILVQLDKVTKQALKDALVDGWLAAAPERLVELYGVPKV